MISPIDKYMLFFKLLDNYTYNIEYNQYIYNEKIL